ncbi:hypothetical protein BVRB_010780 [Beta vulgaris subsp. vulgaris]|uniref:Uncharacterized protein n=1 Tax=Beta vulgaris subsp. vulgaris TaxID=3555 RepID=A0A0J8B5Z6_BETVV|nr:hypothetical protein BVRB_010780 [Beta vulgaris subsp. vulgaris]
MDNCNKKIRTIEVLRSQLFHISKQIPSFHYKTYALLMLD